MADSAPDAFKVERTPAGAERSQQLPLMVNFDLPRNSVRLEQRMGLVHRTGQARECVIFNFCAVNTIQGKLLRSLVDKLERMKKDLGGRVYDAVGHVLHMAGWTSSGCCVMRCLTRTRSARTSMRCCRDRPKAYQAHEQAIGIGQATKHIYTSWVRQRDWRSEERRPTPEFVEQLLSHASERAGMRIEPREDGEHL